MQLKYYFQLTYIAFFLAISSTLTLLCSMIELIEKLRHARTHGLLPLLKYAAWRCAPLFLNLLPLLCWLAMLATIYHLTTRAEWHTCRVLGLTPFEQARPLVFALCFIFVGVLVAKHLCLDEATHQAARTHQRLFPLPSSSPVHQVWCFAHPQKIYRIDTFHPDNSAGSGLQLHLLDDKSVLTTIIAADTFSLKGEALVLTHATQTDLQSGTTTPLTSPSLDAPELARQLLHTHAPHHSLDVLLLWWSAPPSQRGVILTQLGQHLYPLAESFLLALLALFLLTLFRLPLLAGIGVYPLWLGVSMILNAFYPSPLFTIGILCSVIAAIYGLAKAKNSRILIFDV